MDIYWWVWVGISDGQSLNRSRSVVLLGSFSSLLGTLALVSLVVPLLSEGLVCARLSKTLQLQLTH